MVSVSEMRLLQCIFLYIISYNINFSLTRDTLWYPLDYFGCLRQFCLIRLYHLGDMSQAAPLLAVGGNATNKTQSRSDTADGQVEAKRAMSA